MKKAAVALVLVMIVVIPVPAFCGSACAESWKPLSEAQGPVAYAYAPAAMVRSGDRVQVRVRAVEALTGGKERVATILYDIDCRQGTFRMVEVVEEHEGLVSVCKTLSEEFPIRPGKRPHLELLRTRVCP